MAEYYYKFKNSESIYFDSMYWDEIQNPNNAAYTAKVVEFNIAAWVLEYYNQTNKIYQAKYSSFSPNEKEGEFICYYPNGTIRMVIFYIKNKPIEVKVYNKQGSMISNFNFVKGKETLWNPAPTAKQIYISFFDTLGNNILKNNPNATINIFDRDLIIRHTLVNLKIMRLSIITG